jgi:hypothetical protein
MTLSIPAAVLALAVAPAGASAGAASVSVPLDPQRWRIDQSNFKLDPADRKVRNGEVVAFLGHRCMRLSRGLFYARDVDFRDGVIEADIAFAANGVFFGLAFHVESPDQYEVIFFRPGASGTDQAIQYTPGLLGANVWQLYTGPGYTATAVIPREKWLHVRLEVKGRQARLFLDHADRPALVVPDLKLGRGHGSIGFWGHMGDAYFRDLRYAPGVGGDAGSAAPPFLPDALTQWELSEVFDAEERDPAELPDLRGLRWSRVQAESPGMVVINRYRRSPNVLPPDRPDRIRGRRPGGKFALARTVIPAKKEEIRRLQLGYSDEVVVFLNGKPVFSGNNSFGFRQPKFLGLLDDESDVVYLDLKTGDNELVLAVIEYFGGWGFLCRLAPPAKSRICARNAHRQRPTAARAGSQKSTPMRAWKIRIRPSDGASVTFPVPYSNMHVRCGWRYQLRLDMRRRSRPPRTGPLVRSVSE